MRCIDADALRDRLQNLGYDDWNQGTTTTWAEAFIECADMVDEAPTIEPRKKGKWIDCDGGIATCSICGDRWGVYGVMNFCPNCGAKMEDGEEN